MIIPGQKKCAIKAAVEIVLPAITENDFSFAIQSAYDQLPIHLDIAVDEVMQVDSNIDEPPRSDLNEVQKSCDSLVGELLISL